MPPKKKASEVAGPSASNPPPLEQTGGGDGTGGGTGVAEPANGATASEHAPRPSQEARDQQRVGTHGTIRSLDPDRAGGSQGAQVQHTHQRAGASVARLPGPGVAPSNVVRSSSTSRSTRRSPPLPTTPAEREEEDQARQVLWHPLRQAHLFGVLRYRRGRAIELHRQEQEEEVGLRRLSSGR